ncbi:uncharacterized protein LOC118192297 [Stegodyphus dumicola]|uniref:uncharacterized protein LOC118192297 n=1 Tax=Stegodyphus dumicola TaxID=202533 RepID=UPI0015A9A860|nr:uncharacterized protein LOC118192297 [Stegodyphus dumicola]
MTENVRNEVRKRRPISLQEKLEFLKMIDSGRPLLAVAREFGIPPSTARTIVKERLKVKLLSEHYNVPPGRKRMRLGLFRDVEEALHMWFRQMRTKNCKVNGPMLKQKAREFAQYLGHTNFEGSSGWLSRFRERYGLSVKAMEGDGNINVVTGIGMTDEEIVATVCAHNMHSEALLNKCSTNSEEIVTDICPNSIVSANYCEEADRKTDELSSETSKFDSPLETSKFDSSTETPKFDSSLETSKFDSSTSFQEFNLSIGLREAINLTEKLSCFLKQQDSVPDHVWKSLSTVEDFILLDLTERHKQRKITDYFKSQSIKL